MNLHRVVLVTLLISLTVPDDSMAQIATPLTRW
jgi:hypothetical protein